MKLTKILAAAALMLGLPVFHGLQAARPERVLICHYQPNNPENMWEMELTPKAADAHVRSHGDSFGPCVVVIPQ